MSTDQPQQAAHVDLGDLSHERPAGDQPQATPVAHRCRYSWRHLVVMVVVGVLAGVFGALLTMGTLNKPFGAPNKWHDYQARTPQEQDLMAKLRPATFDEATALNDATSRRNVVIGYKSYVATGNFTLPPVRLGERLLIGVPEGVQWVAGPLTNVTLVLFPLKGTPERPYSAPLAWAHGLPVYDPLCDPKYQGLVPNPLCDEQSRQPASVQQMNTHLTYLANPEQAMPHSMVEPSASYYLATGPLHLADYTDRKYNPFLSPYPTPVPRIIMGKGATIVGGRLGYMQLVVSWMQDFGDVGTIIEDPVYAYAQPDTEYVCPYLSRNVQQQFYPGVCA